MHVAVASTALRVHHAVMPTPFESAQLNLHLFELRREPTLRVCRAWFLHECNPATFEELLALAGGEHNRSFRTVLSYWDMACSLVTTGAIDPASFLAAHSEFLATFSKIQPFLAEARRTIQEPDFCRHMEQVAMGMPDALAVMARRRDRLRAAALRKFGTETDSSPADLPKAEAMPQHPA